MFTIYVNYSKSTNDIDSHIEQLILADLHKRIDIFKREVIVIFSHDNGNFGVGIHLLYGQMPNYGVVLISASLVSKDGAYREEMLIENTLDSTLASLCIDYIKNNHTAFPKGSLKVTSKKAMVINVHHNLKSKYYIITNNDVLHIAIKKAKNLYEDTNLVPLEILDKNVSATDSENPSVGSVELSVEPIVLANVTQITDWLIKVQVYFSHIHVAWSRNGHANKYTFGIDNPYKDDININFWLTKYVSALTCIYDNIPTVSRDEELTVSLSRYFKDLVTKSISKLNF